MIDTIKVNNKTIPWLYVERGFEIPSFNYVLKTENVDGRSGSIYKGRRLESYSFDIPLVVRNDYLSHNGFKTHDDVLNELVKFFNYEEQVKLQFKSKDWYWNAYFEGPIKLHKEFAIPVKFTIKVVLTDPYKYSVTGYKNTAISDQVSVVNSGTADTPLIVEARAIKPSSYFMITKNDEDYFMVGDDEVTKEVKDYMPPVYHSEFRDFKGWTKMITEDIPSNDLGGKVGGDFVISNLGEGYKATNFSDAKGWVGAGTKRGLPKAMTDFQITYKCIVEQKGKGAGRTAQHIYDSDGKLLASIGYENKYHDRKIGHIVVTLYNQKGDPKKIYDYQNKPIMYNLDRIVVYMRLRRVGNKFSIKTWKFDHIKDPDRRKPIDMDEKEWIDGGKFYQRPASIIA
ncbi:TPA: phage tail family protein, partial [Staphylococcus aureus]|nr:phage tail family protein [Staphylococcus aureus]HCY0445776.1 phage tail family protein [Staphylococcus aureus]HDJ2567412.1 phage tail family protein [Staphylococcus aureus]HDJ6505031.1 phage tail family protein [Staphylococcus aureus]HEJ8758270.1 phage tail family protein [Staphylococcus aureus]